MILLHKDICLKDCTLNHLRYTVYLYYICIISQTQVSTVRSNLIEKERYCTDMEAKS